MTSKISYPKEGNTLCYQLEENSYWFTHRNECIISLVKRFAKHDTFIDIGGGNGFVSLGLQNAGIKSVLLEPNKNGIRNAKKRGLKNVLCSSLEDAKFGEQSIHSAGIFDVLEHIENDTEFLIRLHSSLKKTGFLFITVPAIQFLWSDEDEFAGHFRRYTIHSLKGKLQNAGFTVVYSTHIFSILLLPILLFRSIPSIFRKRKEGDSSNYQIQHKPSLSVTSLLLRYCFASEIAWINKLKYIPFGSSCLVVAQNN